MLAIYDGTDLMNVTLIDQTFRDGVLRFANGNGLGNFISKNGRAGKQCSLNLLLALGISAHTGNVRSGAHMVS